MTTRSRYTAAITDKPWWLAGGIPAANCIAAYQATGASSLLESFTNLASPGLYDLTCPSSPIWSVNTGWKFNGTNYLIANFRITPGYWTLIARYNDATGLAAHSYMCGTGYITNSELTLMPCYYADKSCYTHGTNYVFGPSIKPNDYGTRAVTIVGGYRNGELSAPKNFTPVTQTSYYFCIGALLSNDTTKGVDYVGNINCVAVYNTTLTPQQIYATHQSMNAL